MVVSVQRSVGRYLLIAGGLLLRAAASIWICRKNSWHHAVTGIHPCEHLLPSQKAACCRLLGVRWVPRTRRVVRRRANMKTMNRCYMNTTNRCYPHLHPFKSHTSVSIGHWQTDVANDATQMLQYDVVKNFEPVSPLADTPMWIAARSSLPATAATRCRRSSPQGEATRAPQLPTHR